MTHIVIFMFLATAVVGLITVALSVYVFNLIAQGTVDYWKEQAVTMKIPTELMNRAFRRKTREFTTIEAKYRASKALLLSEPDVMSHIKNMLTTKLGEQLLPFMKIYEQDNILIPNVRETQFTATVDVLEKEEEDEDFRI